MKKNIFGEYIKDSPEKPPHNGICPKCGGFIIKNIFGIWCCESCEWQLEND